MARKVKEANFWVSYSDLATGLMIVFMVVMLLMVVRSKLQTAMQQDRVKDVVQSIEIILSAKSRLANDIKTAIDDKSVQVDPVTAQVKISNKALAFPVNSAALGPEGLEFLGWIVPRYVCSLWQHDRKECLDKGLSACERVDPEAPGGVRRILVRGHASLQGESRRNRELSAERARSVVEEVHRLIDEFQEASREGSAPPDAWASAPAECLASAASVALYARERLWAVATSDTEHCTDVVNRFAGEVECDGPDGELPDEVRTDEEYQKVTFGLEVTGDDMTGLLLDVFALRQQVGGDPDEANQVEETAARVAKACWRDPTSYHGCEKYIRDCLEGDDAVELQFCDGMFEKRRAEPDGALAVQVSKACAAAALRYCEQDP